MDERDRVRDDQPRWSRATVKPCIKKTQLRFHVGDYSFRSHNFLQFIFSLVCSVLVGPFLSLGSAALGAMATSLVGSCSAGASSDAGEMETASFHMRRGVKRPAEASSEDSEILLLSPMLGAGGLDEKQADELARLMMKIALTRAGKPASLGQSEERSNQVTLGALAEATAAACSSSKGGSVSLNCPLCHRFSHQPVTVACGHSFCFRCLSSARDAQTSAPSEGSGERTKRLQCTVLGCMHELDSTELHVNMALAELIRKWFPEQSTCMDKWREGERLIKETKLEEAIEALSTAISFGKCSFKIFDQSLFFLCKRQSQEVD